MDNKKKDTRPTDELIVSIVRQHINQFENSSSVASKGKG
jgi:hypothetical protein